MIAASSGKKQEDKEEEKLENITAHNKLIYSKMDCNYHLTNKKAIYYNMKVYYEAIDQEYYKHLPLTFHIKGGLNDPEFLEFKQLFSESKDRSKQTVLNKMSKMGNNLWIVKPGEDTNQGCGIFVTRDLEEIKTKLRNCG